MYNRHKQLSPTLRELFNEFPGIPEDILVDIQHKPEMVNALRQKDVFVVIYEVDHEFYGGPLAKGCSPEALSAALAEGDATLIINGTVQNYKLVTSVVLL